MDEAIQIHKQERRIRRFFFGTLTRSMATIVVLFIGSAILYAFFRGPKGATNIALESRNQSKEDLAEANRLLSEKNKADQDRILNLAKENEELKGRGLKEEIKLPEAQKQTPVFTSPGEAVSFLASQEQKKTNTPSYQPLQRISPPPSESPAGHAYQIQPAQPVASETPQEEKKEPQKNLLGGSRAFGSLVHGVAAVPGLPYPVVIDLSSASTGPNGTSRPIKDCSIVAVASADISVERVYMQAKTLNCYMGGEYIEQAVDGYVVDLSDGLIGLKGKADERSGPYIAQLILSSFAAGIAKGLAVGETTTTVSTEGVVTSSVTGNILREGFYSGAGNAAEKLSRKLEQKADRLMTFVQVKPTDSVQIVFSSAAHIPDAVQGITTKEISWVK